MRRIAAASLTRRALLAGFTGGGLTALLAACTGAASPTVTPAPPAPTVANGGPTAAPPPTRVAVGTATRAAGMTAAPTSDGTATPDGGPRLVVTPTSALLDDPVALRLVGLAPGQLATLRARIDLGGQLRDAVTTFRADASGTVDPATQAPDSGTYTGIDAGGLLWSGIDPYAAVGTSGTPTAVPATAAIFPTGTAPTTVTLAATVAGRTVATASVGRPSVSSASERHS